MNTKNNKIPTYLLAGNGFDIALGLKTKYDDFFMVIGLILALDVYDMSSHNPDINIAKYNFNEVKDKKKTVTEQAKELLCGLESLKARSDDDTYEYYKKITETALKWYTSSNFDIDKFKDSLKSCFFADFLGKIINEIIPPLLGNVPQAFRFSRIPDVDSRFKEFILVTHKKVNNIDLGLELELEHYSLFPRFIQILHRTIQKSCYHNWMDLESFIELLVTGNKYLESKFHVTAHNNVNPYLYHTHDLANYYSLGLDDFCLMFEKYISLINKDIPEKYNVNDITKPYKESFQKRNTGEDVSLLDLSKIDAIFSYNYTDTFAKLFHELSENDRIYYINGKVLGDFDSKREESKIVFGYTRDNKNIDVSPKCLIFEKDKQRFLKNIKMYHYDQIFNKEDFNIVIFGHSCSPADGDVFRSILSSPKLNKAVICCYDKDSMASAYVNLVKVLDESPSSDTTINDLIINKKVLFCLKDKKDKKDS